MATKRTSALFLGLALAAMGTSASAGTSSSYDYDYKSLPGATCYPKYGHDADYFHRDVDGSMYHDENAYGGGGYEAGYSGGSGGGSYGGGGGGGGYDYDYKEVICPVLRDGYNRGNYNDWIKAYFWVKSSYGKELKCTLYSSSPTLEKDHRKYWHSTTQSYEPYKLQFEIPHSMKYGSYYFHCRVPKGGRLYYYFYKEAGPTDYDG